MTSGSATEARFVGRAAIVTGAASGIGAAVARRLADEGAHVVLADLNETGLDTVASEIQAGGGSARTIVTDVADEAQLEAMVELCVQSFGTVDILVSNAAAVHAEVLGRDRDVLTMSVQLWDETMRIDLRSQMLGARFVLPHMLRAGRGSIVNLSSVAGLAGDVVRVAYSAAKAGSITLTEYIATMYGKQGIRCNSVAPGLVLGPSAERGLPAATIERLLDNHLTPRLGQPEDIAAVIAFLASDDAAFVTGQLVRADGGALSHLPTFAQQLRTARTPAEVPLRAAVHPPAQPATAVKPASPKPAKSAGPLGAIVTGGGAGIGRATSLTLAAAGYSVVVADVDSSAAERVVAEIVDTGGSALAVSTDVSVEEDVERMVATTLDFAGRLDVLVNNAALMGVGPFGADSDLLTMTSARWDHAFAITLRGQMLACKHALKPMLTQGGGSIVNVSSASALRGDLVRIAYGTAKAGVNSLTRHVATRYGKQGIRCNAVAPGLVRTSGASRMGPEALAMYESVHATPYLGEPEDVAAVIAFLASDAARFVTGQIVGVDGGELSHMLASLVRAKPALV